MHLLAPDTGLVERITYQNAEDGFCVLRVKARGQREPVTLVGHAAAISAGEWITAAGHWVNDRTHGQQFKARFLKTSAPNSVEGIEKYLASGMIRGIGPGLRYRMARDIRGIGFKTADAIAMKLGIDKTAMKPENACGSSPALMACSSPREKLGCHGKGMGAEPQKMRNAKGTPCRSTARRPPAPELHAPSKQFRDRMRRLSCHYKRQGIEIPDLQTLQSQCVLQPNLPSIGDHGRAGLARSATAVDQENRQIVIVNVRLGRHEAGGPNCQRASSIQSEWKAYHADHIRRTGHYVRTGIVWIVWVQRDVFQLGHGESYQVRSFSEGRVFTPFRRAVLIVKRLSERSPGPNLVPNVVENSDLIRHAAGRR